MPKTTKQIIEEYLPGIKILSIKYQKNKDKKLYTEEEIEKIVKEIIFKIAQDEGGHILHYNDWYNDNKNKLLRVDEK